MDNEQCAYNAYCIFPQRSRLTTNIDQISVLLIEFDPFISNNERKPNPNHNHLHICNTKIPRIDHQK